MSERKHYTATIDLDRNCGDLLAQWRNGNRNDVVAALRDDHPGLAVLLIVQGAQDGTLSRDDCNVIANRLIDARGAIALDDSIPFVS